MIELLERFQIISSASCLRYLVSLVSNTHKGLTCPSGRSGFKLKLEVVTARKIQDLAIACDSCGMSRDDYESGVLHRMDDGLGSRVSECYCTKQASASTPSMMFNVASWRLNPTTPCCISGHDLLMSPQLIYSHEFPAKRKSPSTYNPLTLVYLLQVA